MSHSQVSPDILQLMKPTLVIYKCLFQAPQCALRNRLVSAIISNLLCWACAVMMAISSVEDFQISGINVCNFSESCMSIFSIVWVALPSLTFHKTYTTTMQNLHHLHLIMKSNHFCERNKLKYLCLLILFLSTGALATIFVLDYLTATEGYSVMLLIIPIYTEVCFTVPVGLFFQNITIVKFLFRTINKYMESVCDQHSRISYRNIKMTDARKLGILRNYLQIHNSLCDIVESLNSSSALVILLYYSRNFLFVTHVIYYIITTLMFQDSKCDSRYSIGIYFLWLAYYEIAIHGSVHIASSVALEVSRSISKCYLFSSPDYVTPSPLKQRFFMLYYITYHTPGGTLSRGSRV